MQSTNEDAADSLNDDTFGSGAAAWDESSAMQQMHQVQLQQQKQVNAWVKPLHGQASQQQQQQQQQKPQSQMRPQQQHPASPRSQPQPLPPRKQAVSKPAASVDVADLERHLLQHRVEDGPAQQQQQQQQQSGTPMTQQQWEQQQHALMMQMSPQQQQLYMQQQQAQFHMMMMQHQAMIQQQQQMNPSDPAMQQYAAAVAAQHQAYMQAMYMQMHGMPPPPSSQGPHQSSPHTFMPPSATHQAPTGVLPPQHFNRRYVDDQGRMLQRARWVWMTQPEVSAMVETMVKPLCGNSDFYFKAFAHKHRNKLASVTADTGIRIVSEARRAGKGSAREAFLGALGRPARLTPQAPRKALILGTKMETDVVLPVAEILERKDAKQRERAEAREKSKKEDKVSSDAAGADKTKGHSAAAGDSTTKKERAEAKQKQRDAASAAAQPPGPEPSVPARELSEQEKQVFGSRIYLILEPTHGARTGKITGMLLSHYKDPAELEKLCSAPEELAQKAQLCVDALNGLGEGGKGSKVPPVKIPESAPINIPGSPHTPSVLQPVAAIASLFNSREQRIQQQKERRERRKEMLKSGKAAKSDAAAKGDAKDEEKDSDDDAPTSLSWSSSTHATLARDVRLAIERAYGVVLGVEDALLSEEAPVDGWVEGRCEILLDMVGMERLQDSQLVGRCVTSDLTEPKLFQPDDEFLLHALLVTKGITLLTRTAPLLSEQQASDLCFLMFRNLPVLINGCSHFSSSSSNVSGPNLVPLLVTLLLNLFRRLRFASVLRLLRKIVSLFEDDTLPTIFCTELGAMATLALISQGNSVRADGADDDVKQWSALVSVIRSRCIGSFGYMFVATTSKNQVLVSDPATPYDVITELMTEASPEERASAVAVLEPVIDELAQDMACRQQVQLLVQDLRAVSSSQASADVLASLGL